MPILIGYSPRPRMPRWLALCLWMIVIVTWPVLMLARACDWLADHTRHPFKY